MGAMVLVLPGCRKEEKPTFPTPEEYMNDKGFRKDLAEKRKEREGYLMVRSRLAGEMEKMVEQKKQAMPGADDAAVRRALEQDPAWNDLTKRVKDLSTAIEENGRTAQRIVRERLAPRRNAPEKKGISK